MEDVDTATVIYVRVNEHLDKFAGLTHFTC